MKTFFLTFAGAAIAILLFFFIIPLFVVSLLSSSSEPTRPDAPIILSLDLREPLPDTTPENGLGALFGQLSFVDVITRLDRAAEDPDVEGLFIRASEMGIGSARAEELRSAVQTLQENGKFVVAHSQGIYVGGTSAYRAISAADEIWMQDGSELSIPGISIESLFFKNLLEKIGVQAEIEALYEYKNAPNSFKEAGYTQAHGEALLSLAEDLWSFALEDIASDRADALKLNQPLREALENSPYSASEALEMGLIDQLGWPEDAVRSVKERVGKPDHDLLSIIDYLPPTPSRSAPLIAVISGEGGIVTGRSGNELLSPQSENIIASDTMARRIYDAGEDEDVDAIVFRVDSPGGSPTASDQIWQAIEYVQDVQEKPVVISMGSAATSGGYYVSMGADSIVASRSTITGSIGIYGGRFALSEGLEKIGVTVDSVQVGGPYASTYTSVTPMTPDQRTRLLDSLKRGYDRFVGLAAEGRNMSWDDLHVRAKGRVWSGAEAIKQGLVDKAGGLITAIDVAKELAGIEADEPIRLRINEPPLSPIEALGSMFAASEADIVALRRLSQLTRHPHVAETLRQIDAMNAPHAQARAPMILEH